MDYRFGEQPRLQGCRQEDSFIRFNEEGGGLYYPLEGKQLEGYSYLLVDVENKEDYAVCLNMSFWEDHVDKNCDLFVAVGVLPRFTTTICVPLQFLDGQTLFGPRQPGILKTVVKGNRINPDRLTAFGIVLPPSHAQTALVVSNVRLSQEKPELNMELDSHVDELGQYTGRDWLGKTASAEASNRYLAELREEALQFLDSHADGYYGAPDMKFEATGYFRLEQEGERHWLVTPDGHGFFSSGLDCVNPHSTEPVDHAGVRRDFPVDNMKRAFGEEWRDAWNEITKYRLIQWGINTIAAWSDMEFARSSNIPYVAMLRDYPTTTATIYRDFPDVFSEEYAQRSREFAQQLLAYQDDSYLIGYFMSNEPNWAFVDRLNLGYELLRCPGELASKQALIEFLKERYSDLTALNHSWETAAASYEELFKLGDFPKVSEVAMADLAAFSRVLISEYIRVPAQALKEADPHHLNLGIRYAYISSPDLYSGSEYFDIFSINCYEKVCNAAVEEVYANVRMPVMVGEFHFGSIDRGLPATGIRGARDQENRGKAVRHYVEQAAALPYCLGVHHFQLNDQPYLGRFDGENYNIGLVDVCNREYVEVTGPLAEANKRLYLLRQGVEKPISEAIDYIPAIFY
ncbi:beta-galactosidase-like protein [Paenibacillus cellulosilyticus]|uniref:Beta-galactosidase-like protein n=1 Tax=Paenibacillus cellulosilyticus TaxID=375489 RepID=A0A2V2YSE8_9BACL|nr:beta-galactosidase [Paenibacillus cellulosilyticus]PWW00980.1 beta-galactosidase-like protein [Paenibacillus cellulosilyticus]QKS47622.1 beta-galactosidase [Paenibacillus cellulosilyticus]